MEYPALLCCFSTITFGVKFDTKFDTKGNTMIVQPILANSAVSISDFKKSPNTALKEANGQPVAVLTNGKISGYYVSPETWEAISEYLEDIELAKTARSRMSGKRIKVNLDDL
ncbi:prevent-host-death protein [Serratia plymuthica 4Rx13]|nr:prevent-host-death protein [Serratia plymuthica]AGO54508.1 prevent-host-death protein [Serratia plymuthica 4Rx13]